MVRIFFLFVCLTITAAFSGCATARIDQLEQENAKFAQTVSELKSEIGKLRETKVLLEVQEEKLRAFNDQRETDIEKLAKQIAALEKENLDMRAKIDSAESEKNEAIHAGNTKIKELEAEVSRLTAQINSLKTKNEELLKALRVAEKKEYDLKNLNAALEKKIIDMEAEIKKPETKSSEPTENK